MTLLQQLGAELQFASNETEVFLVWTRNREFLRGASLILSVPGDSQFASRVPKGLAGSGRLVSAFQHDNLFFLNEHIYMEMLAGRECTFPVTYTVSFDTNAASYLRGLFENRSGSHYEYLKNLLLYTYPHKLNWQIFPYLLENAEAIAAKKNDKAIFETVLAAERLERIDVECLLRNGEIQFVDAEEQAFCNAAKRLSDTVRNFTNGVYAPILERWEALYVAILFIAIQQIQNPAGNRAPKKLRALIEFMDEELHALFLEFLFIAWDWFSGGKNTAIFNKLQGNAPNLLGVAKNITWDVFHVTQLRQEAVSFESNVSFLVPFFLTYDQALADLVSFCGMKSCLFHSGSQYPMCFTNNDPETLFSLSIGDDDEFIERYLSPEANIRRFAWLEGNGRPDLSTVRGKLEKELVSCGYRNF